MQTHGRPTDVRRASTAVMGFAAAALLGGCATAFDPSLYSDGPLQARIYQPASGALQFAVSQPAYAAVFAIVPGRGATLLYPGTPGEAQRRLSAGTHSYVGSSLSYNRLTYASGVGSFYGSPVGGPTTLILIASEAPLHVSRLMRQPALAGDLRLNSFYSHASDHAVERLAELIIPDPASTNWTYDTYTLWPEQQGRQVAAYRIRCADGQVVLVARGVYPVGCREPAVETPPSPPADTSAGPVDTGRVDPPKRPSRPSEPSRRNPRNTAGDHAGDAREGATVLRPRGAQPRASQPQARESEPRVRDSQPRARASQPRTAPQPRARTAPARERQQAAPARPRSTEKSKQTERSSRASPVS
ncbi:MAG TPA: hypothetical protein VMM17_13195 [Gemmatimonadaceae bacterium]|nr:hypothetical protein [Gemmatimonadaceae bacterium]